MVLYHWSHSVGHFRSIELKASVVTEGLVRFGTIGRQRNPQIQIKIVVITPCIFSNFENLCHTYMFYGIWTPFLTKKLEPPVKLLNFHQRYMARGSQSHRTE